MNNGGQSYRWRRLMQFLELICDAMLWLAPLLVALDKLIAPVSDGWQGSVWPLMVVSLWSAGLLCYQLLFKLPAKKNLPKARTCYLIFSIVMLGAYIGLMQDVSALTMIGLASVAFNSLLYANFSLVFANMIGLETLVLFSSKLVGLTGASYGFKNLMVLTGVVYGAMLLILSLYNSDKTIASEPQPKPSRPTAVTSDNSLTTLINNLSSGIIRLDQQFKINLYNASTLAILDTNATLTGRLISEVVPLTDLNDQPVDLVKLIQKTNRTRVDDELIYTYQTGEKIRLELTISPIKNVYGVTEVGEYILILRDVTLAKNLEMERDEFVSVISHELRTPIAIAEASLSNLELMLTQKTDPIIMSNALKKSHQQIVFLADMTNDLASLARADRAEIVQFELVDLSKMIQGLFEKYQPEVTAKGLQFDLDLDPKLTKIATQPLYLEEILQNLLTNAIKYTENGGITLAAYMTARYVEIAVIDTGLGINKNQQAKIFDKFYRVEDYKTRQTGGTGLGLYVANKLAHKLGAEIKLKSRVGFGSTFSLLLPKSTKLKK